MLLTLVTSVVPALVIGALVVAVAACVPDRRSLGPTFAIPCAVSLYLLPYLILRLTGGTYYYWSQGSGEIEVTFESRPAQVAYVLCYGAVAAAEVAIRDRFYVPEGG